MLETIREFAGERLAASSDEDGARRRHAERMYEIAAPRTFRPKRAITAGNRNVTRSSSRSGTTSVQPLDWAAARDVELGLRLAIALENFWAGNPPEGADRMTTLLERAGGRIGPELRAGALRVLGSAVYRAGDHDEGTRLYEQSLALRREARRRPCRRDPHFPARHSCGVSR